MNAPWGVSRGQTGNVRHRLLQSIAVASSPLRVEEVARFLSRFVSEIGPSRRSHWRAAWKTLVSGHTQVFQSGDFLAVVGVDDS